MAKKKSATVSYTSPTFGISFIIGLVIALVIIVGVKSGFLAKKSLTNSNLAAALLTKEDIETVTKMDGSIIPSLVELNDHFDAEDAEKYGYDTFVARITSDISTNLPFTENALLGFDSADKAKSFLEAKAKEANVTVGHEIDENTSTVKIVQDKTEDESSSVTFRIAVNQLAARVQVYGDAAEPIAIELARKQKEKLEMLLAGNLPAVAENNSMSKLPSNVENTTLVGKLPVTADEWMGATHDSDIPGLQGGGLARFKINARPAEAIEVVVLEFSSEQDALNYKNTFFTEGAHLEDKSSKELTLPDSIRDFSVARTSDGINELAAVKGNYYIDISTFSPLKDFDKDASSADLIKMSEEILSKF